MAYSKNPPQNDTPLFLNIKNLLFPRKSNAVKFSGNYQFWEDAQKQTEGYDKEEILIKAKNALLKVKNGEFAFERDTVLFKQKQYIWSLATFLLHIASINQNKLSVLDFGGALGSIYFQHKDLFIGLDKISWNIVEQKHFVDCGKKYFEDETLRFYYDIEEYFQVNNSEVLLLSGVLQYLPNPYEWINKFLKYDFKYIILNRTAFIEQNNNDLLTIQITKESIYEASYPAWFFIKNKIINSFKSKYKLVICLDDVITPDTIINSKKIFWQGLVFKLK